MAQFNSPEPIPAETFGEYSNGRPDSFVGFTNVVPGARQLPENRKVRRELLSYQIFLIVVSGTIGMGLFDGSGEILRIAGPAGGITAFGIVGIGVMMIMEGIAELIAHWPISNAMFHFVKVFVDKELAYVVGFAYWLAYSVSFATLICGASNLAAQWTWPTSLHDIVFAVFAPGFLLSLNCLGVKWYGNVEAFCGILKIILVIGTFLCMCVINKPATSHALPPQSNGTSTYINAGFQHDPAVAAHPITAILVAMPIATYAFIGVEIVAVTAVEAKNPTKSLKSPAKNIAWITGLVYFISIIAFYFNVSWQDPHLPGYHLRDGTPTAANKSTALIIIAAESAEVPALPSILTAFLIMAVLSAANTALYVASRTAWGVACDFDPQLINSSNPAKQLFSKLSTTTPRKVPGWALVVSCFFIWIPILQAVTKGGVSNQNLQQVMSGFATVGVVLVWASQCVAFIRYRAWLWEHRNYLVGPYAPFDHFNNENDAIPFNSIVGWMQTFPSWIGLAFCFVIVFIFSTASWWNYKESKTSEVLAAFAAPVGLFVMWVILKIIRKYRALEEFEYFIRIGSWGGDNGLKAKLDGLTATINSLEAERNDLAMPLRASRSSHRHSAGHDFLNPHNLPTPAQSVHSGSSTTGLLIDVGSNDYFHSGHLHSNSNLAPDWRQQNVQGPSQYPLAPSHATGSELPESPTRRRFEPRFSEI